MKVLQEATREPAACRAAEAVRQDGTQQPAGADEEGGSRMDVRGGCATKGDVDNHGGGEGEGDSNGDGKSRTATIKGTW
jgi:hypothetical protein